MANAATRRQELVNVIRQVRKRWRMKLFLRGGSIVVGGGLLALFVASFFLQQARFSAASITGFRIGTVVVLLLLAAIWFILPLRRRVSDQQVALYIEEHEPKLQAAILSAVDVGLSRQDGTEPIPPVIIERMIEQAVEKSRTIDGGKAIGRQNLRRHVMALSSIGAIAMLMLLVGPEFFRQGASALLILSRSAEAASPLSIAVKPGDVTVPKGSDQTISAKLAGFRSSDVALMVKDDGSGTFDRMPLVATSDPSSFEGMLFDIKKSIQYYVEADGVRSPTFTMSLVELPAVDKMELEYIFPAYTGLPPQKVESGGDVAALRGTEVRVRITPTMKTPAGRLQLEPAATSGLTAQADGILTGGFKITQDGFYHVELDGPRGEKVTASPKYTVDAIDDQPPTVTFEKPKRDTSASPVEEVFLQARAGDDYGVRQLDLVYTVNGGEEKTATLYGKGAKPLTDVSAGHTLYMEELGVKPGDFVSYYAKATDNDTVKGPKSTTSDIYFVRIRPFSKDFRQAQSQQQPGGGAGGGGGNNEVGALSEQERQIISATFNVERDRGKKPADKTKEDTVFIGLAQSKLREEVDGLVQQMNQRLGGGDTENMRKIAQILPKAVTEMAAAEEKLKNQKTKDALAPEQRALKHLQDAEELYDIEVRTRMQNGGGGGGGGGSQANDLADLFQMELDRMANQYEQQQRATQQNANQKIDEVADRLRELARRQLQQAEQQRRARAQGAPGASGSAQRGLADELEQTARQLEQLRREMEQQGQQRPDLAEAQKRLEEAAAKARQAAANGSQDGGAAAQSAANAINEAQRLLQNQQSSHMGQDVKSALQHAEDLVKQEKQIASQVQGLDQAGAQKSQQLQELRQKKDQMQSQLGNLEQQLGQLSSQALANNQRDTARKLQEAGGSIRDQELQKKIEYSKDAMTSGSEYAKPVEKEIGSNLDTVRNKIADAAGAADKDQQGKAGNRALDTAQRLAPGVQTLNEQVKQATGQQGQGQQGQQGKGQQGQQGQGQQGQGQQGQQGQGQQGQGQQGQGQQGQGQQGQGQQGQGQGQGGQGGGQQNGHQGNRPQAGQQRLDQNPPQGQMTVTNGNGSPAGTMTGNPASPGTTSGGDARPGLNRGDIQQMTNNAQQLLNDAQQLQHQLMQSGANAKDLQPVDDVIKGLRALSNEKTYTDPRGLQQIASETAAKAQQLEYDLRKKLDTTNQQLFLGTEEIPDKFKDPVTNYFKALSKQNGGKEPPAAQQGPATQTTTGRGRGGF